MTRKQLFAHVTAWFQENMPVAETELRYQNPFELLVAVILSAQCTDKRVNMITPKLFAKYPAVELLAEATSEEVFELIRSCSYPNNKSKHLVGMARVLVDKFNGQVPETMDELVQLPGVGRKTANVIVSVVFHQPALAVDTHVFRVSERIGLAVNAKTPVDTEKQLTKYFPRHLWGIAHHWLILHGRYVCTARNPKCQSCGLSDCCHYFHQSVLPRMHE
ncbi:MAG: endonuclease III [Bacteroidales bacterium]|jgi:endonuclease-3|nr:endonuclease III [Bacteroidales bacterium]